MASLSPAAYAKKHARTGDRIARRAARLRDRSAAQQGFHPSTGPSLATQIARALKRPGVVATGRPTTAEGVSAFHFSVRPITKGSDATALAGGTARPGASGAHQRYLEREGAAEKTLADIDIDVAHLATEQQEYIEREAAAEHVLASFGNISNIYEERMEFWRLVEESEYAPKTHVITFNPNYDLAFWKAVDTPALEAPPQLVEAVRDKITELKVDDPTAVAILTFFKAHQSADNDKTPAIGIEIGRGGRIQTRIIAELPHEVSAEKRVQIARDFCETRIANIEPPDPNEPDRPKVLRYWTVIHAPDSDNDSRNNHMHVVFYERPTNKEIDDSTGQMQWDFAIKKTETDKHWNKRTRRRREQKRSRTVHMKSWTSESRAYFATLVNAALEEAGVKRRIDPRRYTDMGIDEEPIPRMEPKAYQKEKQGEPTAAGDRTITAQWDRELKRISALYDTVVFDNAVVAKFNATADRFKTKLRTSTTEVEKTFGDWAKAVVEKRGALAERAAVLFNIAKIRSRLTPPLDHRPKAEIAATKAVIDELQKEELAPLNRLYRGALVKEKATLTALAKLERSYGSTPQAPVVAPQIAPSALKINAGVTSPSPAFTQQSKLPAKSATATMATASRGIAPGANSRTVAPIAPPSPAIAARSAPARPRYNSLSGIGGVGPQLKLNPALKPAFDQTAVNQMAATRTRQYQERLRDWHRRHNAFKEPIEKAISSTVAFVTSAKNPMAALDGIYAQRDADDEADRKFENALPQFDNLIRDRLRHGLPAYTSPNMPILEKELIDTRLKVIANDSDPVIAAAAKAAISRSAQPTPATSPTPAATPSKTPAPTIEPAPTAQQPPIASTPTPEAAKPVGVEARDAKTVEPQPAAAPPKTPAAKPPNIYRRRVRQLTPDERSALTKEHVSSRPKPQDDTPETIPAHAQRRRPALHDEPAGDERTNAPPSTQNISAPPPETRQAAATPTPSQAPNLVGEQKPIIAPAEPIKPAVEAAPPSQQAQPPETGPTVDINALPGAKKRKKKKVSELPAEERRRILIAREKTRGGHER